MVKSKETQKVSICGGSGEHRRRADRGRRQRPMGCVRGARPPGQLPASLPLICWFPGWCAAAEAAAPSFSTRPRWLCTAASLSCSADAKVSTPRVSSCRQAQTPEPPFAFCFCPVPNVRKVGRCFRLMIRWHATSHPGRGDSKIRAQCQEGAT